MNEYSQARLHRRTPFLTGESRYGVTFVDDTWDKANIKPLLDAHYECERPGRTVAIVDVLTMLTTGRAQITMRGARQKQSQGRKLGASLGLVQAWLDAMKQKGGEEFDEA